MSDAKEWAIANAYADDDVEICENEYLPVLEPQIVHEVYTIPSEAIIGACLVVIGGIAYFALPVVSIPTTVGAEAFLQIASNQYALYSMCSLVSVF